MSASKHPQRQYLLVAFELGDSAAASSRKLHTAYGEDALSERVCQQWYRRFRAGDKSLKDKPRSGAPVKLSKAALEKAIKADRSATTRTLAARFGVSHTTIANRLADLGYEYKSRVWIAYNLSWKNKKDRKNIAQDLLAKYKRVNRLKWFMCADETTIPLRNINRGKQWVKRGQRPDRVAKGFGIQEKVTLSLFFNSEGPIYHEFTGPRQTINKDVYIEQLGRVQSKLKELYPRMVNRNEVIFQHDNAPPHKAKKTKAAIAEFGWELLPHPPYSPDVAPADYHVFRKLKRELSGRNFETFEDAKEAVVKFITTQTTQFWSDAINSLPARWQAVVDADGGYFDEKDIGVHEHESDEE